MKTERKNDSCLNCGHSFGAIDNYCPACGQENKITEISFSQFLKDFFSHYFSLDSRFGRSIRPFFFKPGFLTSEYIKGKRMSYANPIRLYLVVSLIHFFVLSVHTGKTSDTPTKERKIIDIQSTPTHEAGVPDTTPGGWFGTDRDWMLIRQMQDEYSLKEISDSLKLDSRSSMKRFIMRQAIKISKSDDASIEAHIMGNIPLLMFLLLPLYALLLKVFFPKKLYINHLIHSLHIHSFVFMALTLYWIGAIFITIPEQINILGFLLLTIYIAASFKNAYGLSKWTATYKVILSGLVYLIFMSIALVFETIISLLTY